jgi:hypothetical protein
MSYLKCDSAKTTAHNTIPSIDVPAHCKLISFFRGHIVLRSSITPQSPGLQCITSNQKREIGIICYAVARLYKGRLELVRSRLKEQRSYEMSPRFEGSRPIVVVNDCEL